MTGADLDAAALAALEALLELPSAERSARLAELAAGDSALRERVAGLLALCERGELGVRAAPQDIEDLLGALESRVDGVFGLAAGDLVGPFRLRERLGVGGMGEVWLARREFADFEQSVAVKVLRRGLESPDLVRRFRQERRLLAGLEHAAIPRLVDGGATADGRPYLAMEYVAGEPIDAWVRRRGLSVEALLRLFIQVCAGVEHAHQRGIVHRDLKPTNVLVDAEGRPKVLDFGIAKALDDDDDAAMSALVTRTGQRVLTLRYASPEQLSGGPLTRAVDIHALGVLIYELLTGRPPYGDSRSTPAELEEAILHDEPRAPSKSLRAELEPERRRVKGDLDNVCLMALRKDPLRRYTTAGSLADDLERLLAGRPVAARRDTWTYRLGRYVRRNRALVGGVVATTSTLVAGILISRAQYGEARRAAEVSARTAYVATIDAVEASVRSGEVRGMAERLQAVPERLRGWEWRHLARRVDRSLVRIDYEANSSRLAAEVVWGDSGRWIALVDHCDLVITDGTRERARHDYGTYPLALAKIPGADEILVGEPTGRFWKGTVDADFGVHFEELGSVENRAVEDLVLDLAVCPRGTRAAASLSSGEVLLFDPRSGKHLARFLVHEPSESCGNLAWSPDGRLVASGGWDETVQLVDADALLHVGSWRAHTMGVNDLAFDPTGRRLVTGSLDRMLCVWDVATKSEVVRRRNGWTLTTLRFLGEDRLLVADSSSVIRIVDALTGEERASMLGHPSTVLDVDFDPSGERFVAVDSERGARVWSTRTRDVPSARVCEYAAGLALHPDGTAAVTAAPDQRVRLWSLPALDELGELPLRAGYALRTDWSADGGWIATAHREGGFALWRAQDRALVHRFPIPEGEEVADVRVAPGGTRVFGLTQNEAAQRATLTGWDGRTGAPLPNGRWVLPSANTERAHFLLSPSGDPLALAVGNYDVWVFDGDGALRKLELPERPTEVVRLAVDRSCVQLLVVVGHALWVYDLGERRWARRLALSPGWHLDLAVHPDGRRIAIGTGATIELLDAETGQRMATLNGHGDAVTKVLWTRDGTTLVSLAYEGDLRVWDSR
jgi:serine/threonine protein kinase/WD40 repeat protein